MWWSPPKQKKKLNGREGLTWCSKFCRRASLPAPSRWAIRRTGSDAGGWGCRSCGRGCGCAARSCPGCCAVSCCWCSGCSTDCCCWCCWPRSLCCCLGCCRSTAAWWNYWNWCCWCCCSSGSDWDCCWSAWQIRGLRHLNSSLCWGGVCRGSPGCCERANDEWRGRSELLMAQPQVHWRCSGRHLCRSSCPIRTPSQRNSRANATPKEISSRTMADWRTRRAICACDKALEAAACCSASCQTARRAYHSSPCRPRWWDCSSSAHQHHPHSHLAAGLFVVTALRSCYWKPSLLLRLMLLAWPFIFLSLCSTRSRLSQLLNSVFFVSSLSPPRRVFLFLVFRNKKVKKKTRKLLGCPVARRQKTGFGVYITSLLSSPFGFQVYSFINSYTLSYVFLDIFFSLFSLLRFLGWKTRTHTLEGRFFRLDGFFTSFFLLRFREEKNEPTLCVALFFL